MCERLPPELWSLPGLAAPMPRRTALLGLAGFALGACIRIGPPRPRRQASVPRVARRQGAGDIAAIAASPVSPVAPALAPPTAGPARIEIVSREAWGAAPLRENHDPMTPITRITVHHTAELGGMDAHTDAELVKGVQVFHQDVRGWADVGYHFLIGRDGRVYEGRSLEVQGAHAGGGNNLGNLGISLIGEFTEALPGDAQLATLEAFLRERMARHQVPLEQVFGHRDFKPTECPGDALYAWLGSFKGAPTTG